MPQRLAPKRAALGNVTRSCSQPRTLLEIPSHGLRLEPRSLAGPSRSPSAPAPPTSPTSHAGTAPVSAFLCLSEETFQGDIRDAEGTTDNAARPRKIAEQVKDSNAAGISWGIPGRDARTEVTRSQFNYQDRSAASASGHVGVC